MSNILEIKNLGVEVDGRPLLNGLDLTIPEGEVHALFGPNGSGKTTLVMAIIGYPEYRVTGGQIIFSGKDITELSLTERARLGIGLSSQRPPTISGVKLKQIVDFVVSDMPERSQQVSELSKIYRMERFLDRDVNAGLSGGEIKKSELFQLLAIHPQFIMLDEPDSGIDLESLAVVGDMVNALFSKDRKRPPIRRAGIVITHTGHILDYVHADKAHIMLDGSIGCSGNPLLLLEEIRKHGYEECIPCITERGKK